jgi:hypothetical protein
MSILERVGVIAPDYEHVPKHVRSGPSIAIAEGVLKWYEIAPPDAPVPDDVRSLAELAVREGGRSGELSVAGELGFVILHRCGEGFYFLLVSTWRNENELWETVWAKVSDDDPTFHALPTEGAHRPTYCVWELAAVCHEREAWSRYLRSARDEDARQDYVGSSFEGPA